MKVRITGITEGPAIPTAGPVPGGRVATYNVTMVDVGDGSAEAFGGAPGAFSIPFRDVSAFTVSAEYELELKPAA